MRAVTGLALLVACLAAGCDSGDAGIRLADDDVSPLIKVEITIPWLLDYAEGLYRDRERLSAENGRAYAAGWNKSLDEANELVDKLLISSVRQLFFQLHEEEGEEPTRVGLAEFIARHAGVGEEEVMRDIDRAFAEIPSPFHEEETTER